MMRIKNAVLLLSAVLMPFCASEVKDYIVTKDSTGSVPINAPMKLGEDVYWGGISRHSHKPYGSPISRVGYECKPDYFKKYGVVKICIETFSNRYRWGENLLVARNVSCSDQNCNIEAKYSFKLMPEYFVNDIIEYSDGEDNHYVAENNQDSLALMYPSLPESRGYNFALGHEVKGSFDLYFKPLFIESEVKVTTTVSEQGKPNMDYVTIGIVDYPSLDIYGAPDGVKFYEIKN